MSENCDNPYGPSAAHLVYEPEEVARYYNYQILMLVNYSAPLTWTVSAKTEPEAVSQAIEFMESHLPQTMFNKPAIKVIAVEII